MPRFPSNDIISLVNDQPLHNLGGSYGPNLRLSELLDSPLDDLALGYATATGDPRLRAAIAAVHDVSADDVVIMTGSVQALFLLAFILCDSGDEAVTTAPVFPPTRVALDVVGARVRAVPLAFDSRYRLDSAAVGAVLSEKTRLVSLATPQNPSGVAIPLSTIREVLALMRERAPGAYLHVDEVYREAVYGEDPIPPSASTLGSRVISTGSLSKAHGAPGLRLGWAITPDAELREQLVLGKFNTVISNSPVDEALALRVFERREAIIDDRRRYLASSLAQMEAWVQANSVCVEWVKPNASAVCCVRLRPSEFDDAAVERFYAALKRERVQVSSGAWFGDSPRVFRVGFGHLAGAELDAALAVVAACFNAARPTRRQAAASRA
jgi:aspartate/methionine/tyrosine aminotransferase